MAKAGAEHITVLITLLDDPRVERTLDSLAQQTLRPSHVLVADGGSSEDHLRSVRERAAHDPTIRLEHLPGSVAASRNQGLALVPDGLVVFLDSDEVAPAAWLETLTRPLREGRADFAGGPTRPLAPPRSKVEAYVNRHEAWFYERAVPEDLALLPMGNSAWHKELLTGVGGFDPRLKWGGEDYDVNLRALARGGRGVFVPEAWVYHDQSGLDSLPKLLRKRYRYQVGAAMAYRKRGELVRRAGRSARRLPGARHPYELLVGALKPVALVHALLAGPRRD